MNYKSFVFALGLLIVSGSCVYAQNKGKNVTKAVEAAVTKKVPVAGAAKAPRVPKAAVSAPKVPVAPRVPTVKTMAPTAARAGKLPPPVSASKLAGQMKAARGMDLTPARVEATENESGLAFVPVQEFAVDFLAEQAEKERLKVREAVLHTQDSDDIVDGIDMATGEPYVEEPLPGREEYEAYRQAVRDALQARKERVEKFGGEDGFHAYREKTYHSALELAEDVALFSSLVPEVSAPPCFLDIAISDNIGYVIEIPTSGIKIVGEDGTQQVLDPQTQVIFFSPNPNVGSNGKFAFITQRSSFEKPDMYLWLSGGRPDRKFAVERPIPSMAGLTTNQWKAIKQGVRERIRERLKK